MKNETLLPETITDDSNIDPDLKITIENVRVLNSAFALSSDEVVLLQDGAVNKAVDELRILVFFETIGTRFITAATGAEIARITKEYLIYKDINRDDPHADCAYHSKIHKLVNGDTKSIFSSIFASMPIYNALFSDRIRHQLINLTTTVNQALNNPSRMFSFQSDSNTSVTTVGLFPRPSTDENDDAPEVAQVSTLRRRKGFVQTI